jgi:hypothetical protein
MTKTLTVLSKYKVKGALSRALDDLLPPFQLRVFELIARCCEARLPISIINTGRTQEQQNEFFKQGLSQTKTGLHVKGLAIDLAPTKVLSLSNWAPADPAWKQLGEIGERCGLKWGGRWKSLVDKSHFEMPASAMRHLIVPKAARRRV